MQCEQAIFFWDGSLVQTHSWIQERSPCLRRHFVGISLSVCHLSASAQCSSAKPYISWLKILHQRQNPERRFSVKGNKFSVYCTIRWLTENAPKFKEIGQLPLTRWRFHSNYLRLEIREGLLQWLDPGYLFAVHWCVFIILIVLDW